MKTFVVDICKTETYVDNNGITWWSDVYEGDSPLDIYKNLIGQSMNGVTVIDIGEYNGIIKAKVKCKDDLNGMYLNPEIEGNIIGSGVIKSLNKETIRLNNLTICEYYGVEGLSPCVEVVEEEDE